MSRTYKDTALDGMFAIRDAKLNAARYSKINLLDYTQADPTGTHDSTAAIAQWAADAVSNGGAILVAPGGSYNTTVMPTFQPPTGVRKLPYAIQGDGKDITIFNVAASSLANSLVIHDPGYNTSQPTVGGPEWRGFTIAGLSSTGTAVGMSFGDVSSVSFRDIAIRDFRTSDGFLFRNQYGWTERVTGSAIDVDRCGNLARWMVDGTGTNSFDYWQWVMHGSALANANGLVFDTNTTSNPSFTGQPVNFVGGSIRAHLNLSKGSGSNTGSAMYFKGNVKIQDDVAWHVVSEIDGGASTVHTGLTIDNASTAFGGFGTVNLNSCSTMAVQSPSQVAVKGNICIPGYGPSTSSSGGPSQIFGRKYSAPIYTETASYPLATGSTISAPTSGTAVLNANHDVSLIFPLTLTSTSYTAQVNHDTFSGLGAGATVISASGTVGNVFPLVVPVHRHGAYLKITVTGCTIGAPEVWAA